MPLASGGGVVGHRRASVRVEVCLASVLAWMAGCAPSSTETAESTGPDASKIVVDATPLPVPDAGPLPVPDAAPPPPSMDAAPPPPSLDAAPPPPNPDAALPPPNPDAALPPLNPDAALPPPSPTSIAPPPLADLTAEPLADGTVTALHVSADDTLHAVVDGALVRIDANGTSDLGDIAPVVAAAVAPDGTLLLATLQGLRAVRGDDFGTPALADALADRFVLSLVAVDDVLFLSTDAGLFAWREGALYGLGFGDEVGGPEYALLAAARDGLWVSRNDALWWLTPDEAGAWRAWAVDTPGWRIDALAVDADDTLWALDTGTLRALRADGTTDWFALPEPAETLSARADQSEVWVRAGASLWMHRDGLFVPYRGAGDLVVLAGLSAGRVALGRADGVFLGVPGRGFRIDAPRGPLAESAVVEVLPAQPEQVERVTAQLDDGPVTDLDGPPWRVTLDAAALGNGPHRLSLTTAWQDAPPATARYDFVVAVPPPPPPPPTEPPPPTWSSDIAPLFEMHCAQCHGPRGFAHPIPGAAGLRAEFELALAAVRERRMPLPPNRSLSADEIALLVGWSNAGFPE